MLVTLAAMLVWYGGVVREYPKLHTRTVAAPALLCGALWSVGNFSTVYAVQYLGMAVGIPLVQCQLIVSTSWSIWWYREVKIQAKTVSLFLGSTFIILCGMILLSLFGTG